MRSFQERKLSLLYENIDPVNELIPIKPVAHYSMGGIEVDKNSQTNIAGLFAVGECANHKVHGANRLGGNSLLELIVFGKEAGKNASEYSKKNSKKTDISKEKTKQNQFLEKILKFGNEIDFYKEKRFLGEVFYEKVGIVRTKKELLEAKKTVSDMKNNIPKMGVSDKSKIYNTNLIEFLEFINMVDVCKEVIDGALKREVSCGAHFRVDD
jgi:succinate dehydrogenase / fumarate reductase flavoprotein subunit